MRGCGIAIHIPGTGGRMACGARLQELDGTSKHQFCDACAALPPLSQAVNTPSALHSGCADVLSCAYEMVSGVHSHRTGENQRHLANYYNLRIGDYTCPADSSHQAFYITHMIVHLTDDHHYTAAQVSTWLAEQGV